MCANNVGSGVRRTTNQAAVVGGRGRGVSRDRDPEPALQRREPRVLPAADARGVPGLPIAPEAQQDDDWLENGAGA